MKKYTLKNLIKDIETKEPRKEQEKKANKHFYIIDTRDGSKILKANQKSELLTLAEYLNIRATTEDQKTESALNLGRYADDWRRCWYNMEDEEEIYIIYPSKEKAEEITEALLYFETFSESYSRGFYYMEERRGQFSNIYNYLSYFIRELTQDEQQEEKRLKYFYLANEIEPYAIKRAQDQQAKDEEHKKRDAEWVEHFKYIFNHSLDFAIDLELDNEKPNGLAEMRAIKLIDSIGAYNGFNIIKFDKIITYCNKFTKYYNENNPNNYAKRYTAKFGREGSPVMYIEIDLKDKEEAEQVEKDLKEISKADECWLESVKSSYFGVRAVFRIWWD